MSNRSSLFRRYNSKSSVKAQHERFQSLPHKLYHEKFFKTCVNEILSLAVFRGTDRSHKVLEFRSPEHMEKMLDLKLKDESDSDDKLLDVVRQVITYSVKIGHPFFLNQLYSGVDPYGLIGQWLTDALNPSIYAYEDCPVFTVMEAFVLEELRRIVGFKSGDGTFCPGGSLANAFGINCARFMHSPDIKNTGLSSLPRLVLFASKDAHYSIVKMAAFMGIGSNNVYNINTDSIGKLSIEHLEIEILRALNEGAKPFMISANAGTSILGAYDPLEEIADMCLKYKLWMHVDASYGGGALMSPNHRHLLKGIERADSVTWNLHGLLAAPQQCTVFLTKECGILRKCHSKSTNLFQQEKFYDANYDVGDKHIQFGRRADVLKFWFMWRAKGTKGLQQHIDRLFDNAEYFRQELQTRDNFKLVLENPECVNVCFWYLPPSLINHERDESFWTKLHQIAPKIKELLVKEGTMMLTYQSLSEKPNFFRMTMQNSGLNKADMKHVIDEIDRLGITL